MPAVFDAEGNYLHDADPVPEELIVLTVDEKLANARAALDAAVDSGDVVSALAALRAALG